MKTRKIKNEVNIGEAIREFIRVNGMEERIMELSVIDAWFAQTGAFMEKYTDEVYVKNRKLYVRLNSPAFKNELQYGKSKLMAHINGELKEDFVQELIFL